MTVGPRCEPVVIVRQGEGERSGERPKKAAFCPRIRCNQAACGAVDACDSGTGMWINLCLAVSSAVAARLLWAGPGVVGGLAVGFAALSVWELLLRCQPEASCVARHSSARRLCLDDRRLLPRLADHRRDRQRQDAWRRERDALGTSPKTALRGVACASMTRGCMPRRCPRCSGSSGERTI